MKKLEKLGEARAPDGTVLTLYRHDGAYSIRVNGIELMSTRRHQSEDRLAELVCAPLSQERGAEVLVGGLGLGFTLRAALPLMPPDGVVVVAELVEAVIDWNRNPEYALSAGALADPRVLLQHADVAYVLKRNPGRFDGIMLDVDNGAESFTTAGNAGLYREVGIHYAAEALRPGGRLAYWSATPDPAFERALRDAGLTVQAERVRSHATSGTWHTIFVAQRARERPAARARDRAAPGTRR